MLRCQNFYSCRLVILFIHIGVIGWPTPLQRELVVDTNVWLEELPQDLVDVFQFDLS